MKLQKKQLIKSMLVRSVAEEWFVSITPGISQRFSFIYRPKGYRHMMYLHHHFPRISLRLHWIFSATSGLFMEYTWTF